MKLLRLLAVRVRRGSALPSLVMVLLGLLFIAMMNIIIKYLGQYDYDGSFLSFMRSLSGLSFAVLMLWGRGYFFKKKTISFKVSNIHLTVLRGLFVVVSQICFFTSLHYIELGTARALNYTSAIFVTILAMIFLKERCGIWRSSALCVGLIGTFIIVSEGATLEADKLPYYLLALFSALSFAGSLITLSFFDKKDNNLVLVIYAQISTSIIGALALTFIFDWQIIASIKDFSLMWLTGFFGTIGVLFITYAYRMAQASLLAPFQYVGIIYALLFGWLFFGENPLDKLFPGALLIVGAGIVIAVRESIKKVQRPETIDDD